MQPDLTQSVPKRWDIFCRVIDNFGDAGVCWRLARQLTEEHGRQVCLWIDDLPSLSALEPALNPNTPQQHAGGVEVRLWPPDFPQAQPAEVVIEAFACTLPDNYLTAMGDCGKRGLPPFWFNLEYLSTETWASECHGLLSPHPRLPLSKRFFFPGFLPGTGGLLRERSFDLGDAISPLANLPSIASRPEKISLFCYDHAPLREWLPLLADHSGQTQLSVCAGKAQQALARYYNCPVEHLPESDGRLALRRVPFMPQTAFDPFLQAHDLNCVRGEDSLIRAIWSGKPFVWHLYPQDEDAHLPKLHSFLDSYSNDLPAPARAALTGFFLAWNQAPEAPSLTGAWAAYLSAYADIAAHALSWARQQSRHADLAQQLIDYTVDRV